MRFYCKSTGPIGGLNCEVLPYFNWSHRWSHLCGSTVNQLVPYVVSIVRFYCTSTGPIGGLNCEVLLTRRQGTHLTIPSLIKGMVDCTRT